MTRRRHAARHLVLTRDEWTRVTEVLALTPRQVAIIRELMSGRSDKHITKSIRMSLPTLRTHLSRLYAATDCGNRLGLVLQVVEIALEMARSQCHQK